MAPKELSEIERDILRSELNPVEVMLALEERARQRSASIRAGMSEAAQRGVHVGRPRGSEALELFLGKYQPVVDLLGQGRSIRAAARETGVAINTVRKVAAALEQRQQGGS